MVEKVLGVVEAVAPMKLIVVRVVGSPPRIGARVVVDGVRGRVVDVIGPVDSPYIVVRPEDPASVGEIEPGAEVVLAERPRRRGRGRGRKSGRRRVQRKPDRKRGRKGRVRGHRRGS